MKYYLDLFSREEYYNESLLEHGMKSCFSHGHIKIIKRTNNPDYNNYMKNTVKYEYKYDLLISLALLPLTLIQVLLYLIYTLPSIIYTLASIVYDKLISTQHPNKENGLKIIFRYVFATLFGITSEIKWFLSSIVSIKDNGRSKYEAKFYIYAAILTISAITVMALNTVGIISLSMTAGIAMHAAAALLLVSMICKAAYKVYNGEKKHLLTTAALTVGLATMALSVVHIYDMAVITEIQAIVTHPAALIAPLAIMAIAAILITAFSAYKKISVLSDKRYTYYTNPEIKALGKNLIEGYHHEQRTRIDRHYETCNNGDSDYHFPTHD